MKGWSRHGVCTWAEWPYDARKADRLTPQRQLAALKRPLGAYYRVRHLHLNQMQAALSEAGILYASAQRSEEHTSELQSLMRIWYAVFCLTKNRLERAFEEYTGNRHPLDAATGR